MSFANWRQAQRLKNNVFKWNQWRKSQPNYPITLQRADFRKADLYGADLSGADLQWANLSGTNLSEANLSQANLYGVNLSSAKLTGADLSGAILCGASLKRANLRQANLCGADLSRTDLSEVNLKQANLHKINLKEADLSKANLSGANLCEVDLSQVNLSGLNLCGADLSQANLSRAQALDTRFDQAIFTGSCLEDWQVNDKTTFDSVKCDYVYLKADQQERRPKYGFFESGEFAALLQQTVAIDLIFQDGINWQAFYQAFEDLRRQYAEQYIALQAIEKKLGGALVIRLEVPTNVETSTIKGRAQELYDSRLMLVERQYRGELNAQEDAIVAARELSTNLVKMTELLAAKPLVSEGQQLVTSTTQPSKELSHQNSNGLANTTAKEVVAATYLEDDDWDVWA